MTVSDAEVEAAAKRLWEFDYLEKWETAKEIIRDFASRRQEFGNDFNWT